MRVLWNILYETLRLPFPTIAIFVCFLFLADTCSAAELVAAGRSAASTTPSVCTGTPRWPVPPPSATSPAIPATRAPSAGESHPGWNSFFRIVLDIHIFDRHLGQLSPAGDNDNHSAKWQQSERSTHFHHRTGAARHGPGHRSQWGAAELWVLLSERIWSAVASTPTKIPGIPIELKS